MQTNAAAPLTVRYSCEKIFYVRANYIPYRVLREILVDGLFAMKVHGLQGATSQEKFNFV